MIQQIARTVIRRTSRNGIRFSSNAPSDFRPAHMNELPIPQGSWQKNYDQKQKLYNMQLAAGIVILSATIGFVVQSDLMFFNAFPPKPKQK